jgi:hypothetical protein
MWVLSSARNLMTEILAVEMAALLLALLSIGAADALYYGGRISRRLHSLWVSFSLSAMCLPVLGWVATVFVGPGIVAQGPVGIISAALFFALYRNLRNQPAIRKLGHPMAPPSPPAENVQPPANG